MKGRLVNALRRKLRPEVLALIALIPAIIIVYLSQKYMAQVDPILRIANLLGTLFHEGAGHSLFCLATGGGVKEFVVHPDGSGFANIYNCNWWWALPAGYMVTTLLPATMFLINNRTGWGEVVPFTLGAILFIMTLLFGAKLEGGITTFLVGFIGSALLIYVGWHREHHWPFLKKKYGLSNWAWMFIVNVICLYYGLGGILSLEYISRFGAHGNSDDISRFTDTFYPWMEPKTMAFLLMSLSIVVWLFFIFVCVRYIFRKLREKQ